MNEYKKDVNEIINKLKDLPIAQKIDIINFIKQKLHKVSPFQKHPVDCVIWVKTNQVEGNNYNPNFVAAPELGLLRTSILEDGYTQPIVALRRGYVYEIIDGFHRTKLAKECNDIKKIIKDYIPIAIINKESENKDHRISATIRHNRARGKHQMDSMSKIVIGLKKNGWSDKKISRKLGMDEDEILRLSQISGLMEIFQDKDFSQAWEFENYER